MKNNKQLALSLALGAALMGGTALVSQDAHAADSLFSLNEVNNGVLIAKDGHSCGAGSCGGKTEKSCGSKDGDKHCGGEKDGEKHCGGKDGDHQCGGKEEKSCGGKH